MPRKRILFAWELGGGFGHIVPIRVLSEKLLALGCEIYVAARELTYVAPVFAGLNVKLLQAPTKQGYRENPRIPTQSYAQLLYNNGFSSAHELEGLVAAWRNLFDLIKPDVVLFDHSPSALVAGRLYGFRKATLGVGFSVPPPGVPFGPFHRGVTGHNNMLHDDNLVLQNVNDVLRAFDGPVLEKLDGLLHDRVEHFFLSLPEFDHFAARTPDAYHGPVLTSQGKRPAWPGSHPRKAYIYMKQFPGVEAFLKQLGQFDVSFIVFVPNIDRSILARCVARNVHYESGPLDLALVSEQVDFAVINANHSTSCQLVLAGIPTIMVPLQVEQYALALRLQDQDLAKMADPEKANFVQRISMLIRETTAVPAAQARVREKYLKVRFDERHAQLCEDIVAAT